MFLVAGIPRASTTLAAKLMSLTDQAFCYAGETHLVPFLHGYFKYLPCHPAKFEHILTELNQILTATMLEAPRYNVSQGAHPGNLIFDERHVRSIIDQLRPALKKGAYGIDLYKQSLLILESVLADVSDRRQLGEKTPDNLLALASYNQQHPIDNVVVIREPIGVLRSMDRRVQNNDPYSGVFSGGIESNIGIYLESLKAVEKIHFQPSSHLVRFEDLATTPADTLSKMYKHFDLQADNDILNFVEHGRNQAIADKAPMFYQRLKLKTDGADFSGNELWKILNLTRNARQTMGYSDQVMANLGFDLSDIKFEGAVKTSLIPLYGFNVPDISPSRIWNRKVINRWMKNSAKLIFYVEKPGRLQLTLNFMSAFPDYILSKGQASLNIKVNDITDAQIGVKGGLQKTSHCLTLTENDFQPVGQQSAYAMIDLEPEISYCPAAHSENSWDVRTLSFQLTNWSVKNT